MDKVVPIKLKAELYLIVFLCVLAIVVEIFSFCPWMRPNTETFASWFQRSGAITTIFSALAQFRTSRFRDSIQGTTYAESWWLYYLFENHYQVLSWVTTIIAIWGAIVWGYGDLIVKYA